ncbi:MAG: diphosphomevalonate decarboxylase [Spirochaetales bacterium]|nr:diphosphomevalonate decarboxylase [Spirochaetales bacterium]
MGKMINITTQASPSLALIKYWGKQNKKQNLPATTSLAMTLDTLHTTTEISFSQNKDVIRLNGIEKQDDKIIQFLDFCRKYFKTDHYYTLFTENNFPTKAGIASSASGFAALAAAVNAFENKGLDNKALSALARRGSASASRSVFGGFTLLKAGAREAIPLENKDYWPELRVMVCLVSAKEKFIGSREAMEASRTSSPYYSVWIKSSRSLCKHAIDAFYKKDFEKLGWAIRQSYLRMFSTMFTAHNPIIYWEPGSLQIIQTAETLRKNGIAVFETMDAGPQVKLFYLEPDEKQIKKMILQECPDLNFMICSAGKGVRYL